MAKKITRGEAVIEWIEDYCHVPDGRDVGKKVILRKWQKEDIKKIYDNPHGTRLAIISFARKNGKTALAAMLLLCHLCGVEAVVNGQLYSSAMSKEQAALLFSLAFKMVLMSPRLLDYVKYKESSKELSCPELGTVYKALSADVPTAHGKSPVFIVHDELGQVRGPNSKLYEALETADDAHDDPLSIIISTQAPTDGDLLSILIDDALAGHDPTTTISLYTAEMEIDPYKVKAMKQANPAYGDFMNAKSIKRQAKEAKRMPSKEAGYRNLKLNQRVEMETPFISRTLWKECFGETLDSFEGYPVYAGLDLSEVNDLTALVLVALIDGVWQTKPIFWLPKPGLEDRSRADRVPYDVWAKQGHLQTVPGKSIEYHYIAPFVRELFDTLDIRCIAFDRYNFKHFRKSLVDAGFTDEELETKFNEFGQGYVSMSPALRDLESAILNGKLMQDGNPVMTMCAANARVIIDPAGNKKLTKQKASGRIDGMISLAMAISVAATHEEEEIPTSPWDDPNYKMASSL